MTARGPLLAQGFHPHLSCTFYAQLLSTPVPKRIHSHLRVRYRYSLEVSVSAFGRPDCALAPQNPAQEQVDGRVGAPVPIGTPPDVTPPRFAALRVAA